MNVRQKNEQAEHLSNVLLFTHRPPARTNSIGASVILGMTDAEVGVLVSKKMLVPLGAPPDKAAKWFSTRELFRLAEDTGWLSKATKTIQSAWRLRNGSRKRLSIVSAAGENEEEPKLSHV